jgi:arylsulfatase A-like enzyme
MKAIVLVARGLQARALGCYGNQCIDTPALDRLAAEGVVFDHHFAANADPAAARRSLRSGRYHLPSQEPTRRDERAADLLEGLKVKGVQTHLVFDASKPCSAEFSEGWGEVSRIIGGEDMMPLEATLEAVGAALERLEDRENWMLWVDLATLLPPWQVPEEFLGPYFMAEPVEEDDVEEEDQEEQESEETEAPTPLTEVAEGPFDPEDDQHFLSIQTSYAAAVSYLDAAIGQLLEALDGLKGGKDVLLVVTADVGQNLGEHGVVGPCRAWLHEELIRLPLLVRLPQAEEAGRHVEALTQAVDLAPTLADWFGAPLPDAQGQSVLALARGRVETLRAYACAGLRLGTMTEYALRTSEWAFLWPQNASGENAERTPQLFVKPDDRDEVNNVVQHHLELADQLERTLRDFVTAAGQPGALRPPPLPDQQTEAKPEEPAINP